MGRRLWGVWWMGAGLALVLAAAFAGRLRWREAASLARSVPPVSPGAVSAGAAAGRGLVVGYYPGYARGEGFLPGDLAAERLTAIHYAFAGIDEEGRVALADPAVDLPSLAGLRALREERPGLRLLLSVGGWDRSEGFSDAAATPEGRKDLARSAVALMAEQGLDGIDLDWEFPVSGGKEGTGHRHQDGENYPRLLWELRQALDAKGREEGRQYLLSAAVPLGKEFLSNNSPAALAEPVDYLFLMGYDLHGPWSDAAGFNAPLADLREGTLPYTASVREGVEGWLRAGVPAEKLVLGMPLYGYRYQLAPVHTGHGSRFLSARSASYDRIVAEDLSRYPRSFQDTAQVPYLLGEGWFISYDDPSSIAAKARFAREKGLGGIGFWELSQDRGARLVAAGAAAWENVQNTP